MQKKTIVLDTETTGFKNDAEVIQIGIIDLDGHVLMDTFVQCQGDIPDDAIEVHGITKDRLIDAPLWTDIHDQLSQLLLDAELVVIYNDSFDIRLMQQTAKRYDLKLPNFQVRCAMREYANTYFDGEFVKLSEAAHYENVDMSAIKAHSAIDDCEMTRLVWLALQQDQVKKAKHRLKREELHQLKTDLIPDDADSGRYTDYGQGWRPKGYKTLSQLLKRDIKYYEFAGTCCNSFGDRDFLFRAKEISIINSVF